MEKKGRGIDRLPYYYDASGNLPPWFNNKGKFDPNKYDSGFKFTPRGETYQLQSGYPLENPFDLRNLRVINPREVIRVSEELKDLNKNDLPSACLIGTGGTIAMRKEGESLVPVIDTKFLLEYTGRMLNRRWNIVSFSFPTLIDSSQMKMDYDADMVVAMSYLWVSMDEDSKKQFRGFLITHGTDTMSPSTTRVAMMLGSNLEFSVGAVGAQTDTGNDFSDVADNMARSMATLDKLYTQDRSTVFIYMGGSAGGAYNPAGAIKISDTDVKAFASPAMPQIIDASNTQEFEVARTPFTDTYKNVRNSRGDVFQPIVTRGYINARELDAKMDIPPEELFDQIRNYDDRVIAIMLTTYGSFTFDHQQVDAIIRGANTRRMLVFATNPFPTGRVDHAYADAQYLIAQGAVPLFMMPHAAEVKLKIAQAIYGRDLEKIGAFMTDNNYVGEQPGLWTPRSTNSNVRQFGQPEESLPRRKLEFYPKVV